MFLVPVDENEILNITRALKNITSNDTEGFNTMMTKKIMDYTVTPLTILCNWSLTSGVFPDKLKIAKIIPLFKSGDKHLLTNYRPVSILPQFSKILEKVFYNRLKLFFEKSKC